MHTIVFYDYDYDEYVVPITFETKIDAEKWAECLKFEYQDIAIDEDGNDYWKTFNRYFNPDNSSLYNGYDVRSIEY